MKLGATDQGAELLQATALRVATTALLLQRGCPPSQLDAAHAALVEGGPVPEELADMVREADAAIAKTQEDAG